MIIKNRKELATSWLREKALDIIEAGIERVLPSKIMRSSVYFDKVTHALVINEYNYKIHGRIFVIGGGKAPGLMAQTLEEIIGPGNIEAGIVVDKADPAEFRTQKIRVMKAGHPVPDELGVAVVRA